MYCAVQKNSVPAAAGAVATSHTVFLLNIVCFSISTNALGGELEACRMFNKYHLCV